MIKIRKRQLTLDDLLKKIDAAGLNTGNLEYENNYDNGSGIIKYNLVIFIPKFQILEDYKITIRIIFRRKIPKLYLFDESDLIFEHPTEILSLEVQNSIKALLCQSILGKIPINHQKQIIHSLVIASEKFNGMMNRYWEMRGNGIIPYKSEFMEGLC
jgi:hypothetical protein